MIKLSVMFKSLFLALVNFILSVISSDFFLCFIYFFVEIMSNSDTFCLKWNEFEKNVSSTLKDFKDDEDFFDVTLACEEEQVQAHKLVLSACSPYFRSLFMANPSKHPVVFVKVK